LPYPAGKDNLPVSLEGDCRGGVAAPDVGRDPAVLTEARIERPILVIASDGELARLLLRWASQCLLFAPRRAGDDNLPSDWTATLAAPAVSRGRNVVVALPSPLKVESSVPLRL
jgi:hypothetical protein